MTRHEQYEMIYWGISLLILIATIYYIATSPVKAVRIGRELDDRYNKIDAKLDLFLMLFSLRGAPLAYDFVNGLNQIDVVFQDTPTVLSAWHNYYDALHQMNVVNQDEQWTLLRVELLSQMAISLGYGELKQVDIQKYYTPVGHQTLYLQDMDLKDAALKFFQQGHRVFESAILKTANEDEAKKSNQQPDA